MRSLAFDPSNEWFCTGSADRTIKIWDVATGQLKLTLTGHIEQASCPPLVRFGHDGIASSHPCCCVSIRQGQL